MGKKLIVDSRGRIVIPKEIRKALKIQPGTEIEISIKGNTIILRPYRKLKIKDLFGIAGEEKVDINELEDSLSNEDIGNE